MRIVAIATVKTLHEPSPRKNYKRHELKSGTKEPKTYRYNGRSTELKRTLRVLIYE